LSSALLVLLLLLLAPPCLGLVAAVARLLRLGLDARLADLFSPAGVPMVRFGLAERGDDAAAAAAAPRERRAGAGVAGVWGALKLATEGTRLVLGEFCALSCNELGRPSSCWRINGDLNGFRRVAFAASIRRRLAAGPPGVWNDILGIAIVLHFWRVTFSSVSGCNGDVRKTTVLLLSCVVRDGN
jgi:hypothetical protein